eukprot:gene2934-1343_t
MDGMQAADDVTILSQQCDGMSGRDIRAVAAAAER